MIKRILTWISRILLACSALALALMVLVLCWQVVARYLLNFSPPWAEQMALLLMIWMTFLGSAAGIADGFHIRIAEGVESLPDRWRGLVGQLANALIILAGLLIAIFGCALVLETSSNTVPTLPVTKGFVYSVIPLSGLLMALFAADHLVTGKEAKGSRGSA